MADDDELNELTSDKLGALSIMYSTPWSPFSESFITHVSNLFPSLRFEIQYEEESGEYVGVMVAKGGKVKDLSIDFHKVLSTIEESVDPDDEESLLDYFHKRDDLVNEERDRLSGLLLTVFPIPTTD